MERRAPDPSNASVLASQVRARAARKSTEAREEPARPVVGVVSTGSTLLDLAISGTRFDRGGIPGGILVEIFGPSGAGKTVMLCELAGAVQRAGGEVMFRDPEGRLNSQFAQIFGFKVENALYDMPGTVPELFEPVRKWQPRAAGVNAVFADSLAALSTQMELEDGDKYGMRRAKEFSEECRKVCRTLTERGILMVCSNQVRQNPDAGLYGEKFKSPGGEAIPFYSSLRLRCSSPHKIYRERDIGGKKQRRVAGVETTVQVYKSSIDVPYREAKVNIIYDYGIDDVRGNLEYVKSITWATAYTVRESRMGAGLDGAVLAVEKAGLEEELRTQVVELWRDVEAKFKIERQQKRR